MLDEEEKNQPETTPTPSPTPKEPKGNPLGRPSKLLIGNVSIGLAAAALCLVALTVVGFVTYGNGLQAGLIFGVLGALLSLAFIGAIVYQALTKKAPVINTVGGQVVGGSVAILALVGTLVLALVRAPENREGGESGEIGPSTSGEPSDEYDDLSATLTVEPEEDANGMMALSVYGGFYAGDYEFLLFPYDDLRVYSFDYVEPTYETKEVKTYAIKALDTYAAYLLKDKRIENLTGPEDCDLPRWIIVDALKLVEPKIKTLEVVGEALPFSSEGFDVEVWIYPTVGEHGALNIVVDHGEWKSNYGFEIPSFTDTRFYDDYSTSAGDFEGGTVKYTLKETSSLYDLFKSEILTGYDGLTYTGYFENETHTEEELNWFKLCFDEKLGEIYKQNELYEYSAPGEPAYADQLTFTTTYGGYATCTGVKTSSLSTLKNVVIPDTVVIKDHTYTVEKISEKAFYGNLTIETVTFGSNVTIIDKFAFAEASNLQSVTFSTRNIDRTKATIRSKAFEGCGALASLTFNESVIRIENYAFEKCGSLNNVTFDASVRSIADYAFLDCGKLAKATFAYVKSIGTSAFQNCALTDLRIPSSLESIGPGAFAGNDKIEFSVDPDSEFFSVYKGYLLERNENGYGLIASSHWVGQGGDMPEFGYGEDDEYPITSIGFMALANRPFLTKIAFGERLMEINSLAFRNCENLIYVDLSKTNITRIDNVFTGCMKLKSLTGETINPDRINGKLRHFGFLALADTGIEELHLDGETGISDLQPASFANMAKLRTIELPGSIRVVHAKIFDGDINLGVDATYGVVFDGSLEQWKAMDYCSDE